MEQNKKLKMLNAFSAISIIAFLASIGVWVLMGFNIIEFSGFMVVVAGILTTLSLTVTLCLPWIKKKNPLWESWSPGDLFQHAAEAKIKSKLGFKEEGKRNSWTSTA